MKRKPQILACSFLVLGLGLLQVVFLKLSGQELSQTLNRGCRQLLGAHYEEAQISNRSNYRLPEALSAENSRLHGLTALAERVHGRADVARVARRDADNWWAQMTVEFTADEPPQGTAMVLTPGGVVGSLLSESVVLLSAGQPAVYSGQVDLLTAPGSQVSVLVGDDEVPYLLEGTGAKSLRLRPVTSGQPPSAPGTSVKTAGLGEIFARDMVVAKVEKSAKSMAATPLESTPSEVLLWWR